MKRWILIGGVMFAIALTGTFLGQMAWAWHLERQAKQAEEEAAAQAAALAASPVGIQREAVRAQLNDPDSAIFRNERQSTRAKGVWCGEINARNRMGGMVGFTRYIAQLEEDRELRVLDKIRIEPTSTIGEQSKAELQAFQNAWRLFCQ